ncbi:hypothetical protein POM88_014778 [Heracleum sosnowskyi]|uniref:Uncharacterized protein n=1 Tax=Heracleum sosnowskyi TaxID=360622 RepID=A0AAD8IIY5_9APIA|nr:hypothetical protein POM88_014778 [Heracleum sosnowskyi]
MVAKFQLRNVSPTEKEIEELQLEDIVDIDIDNVGRLPPSLRGASTSSDQPESRMSQLEMENIVILLTFEVDCLNKTIFEMYSHFDLEFSKLRAIVDKQNESTLDPLPYLNQVATNVDIGAHRSRLAFLFYSYGMATQIYNYESESNNIAKVPTTKAPSTKAYDKKRKARDVKK